MSRHNWEEVAAFVSAATCDHLGETKRDGLHSIRSIVFPDEPPIGTFDEDRFNRGSSPWPRIVSLPTQLQWVRRRAGVIWSPGFWVGVIACWMSHTASAGSWSDICGPGSPDIRYIALGPTVLALPPVWRPPDMYALESKPFKELPAPDPSQPRGCYGNPAQVGSYALPEWPGDIPTLKHQLTGDLRALKQFQLIQPLTLPKKGPFKYDGWPGETVSRQTAERMCEHAEYKESLSDKIMVCSENLKLDDFSFIAEEDFYRTPTGTPFTFICSSRHLFGHAWCRISYTDSTGIGLEYLFVADENPAPPSSISVADQALKLDEVIRRNLAAIVVAGYHWGAVPSPNVDHNSGGDQ